MGFLDPPGVSSVAGRRGAVALVPTDIGTGVLPVFDVTRASYGGTMGTGLTSGTKANNLAAIKAAHAAAAAAGGGIVYIPAGIFDIGASSGPHMSMITNNAGLVRFKGAGKTSTEIRLGNAISSFIIGTGTGTTYRYYEWEDFTLDNNNVNSFDYTSLGTIATIAGDCNVQYWFCRRVDSINAGTLKYSGIERRGLEITISQSKGATTRNVNDILVEDCMFEGGNYAVHIQGYASNPYEARDFVDGTAVTASTNAWCDRITVRNVTFDSGSAIPSSQAGYSSCAVMVGGSFTGGSLILDNVRVKNGGDDLIEAGGMRDVTIRNCQIENAKYEKLLFANFSAVEDDRQRVLIEKCDFMDSAGQPSGHILINNRNPFGHFTIRDCTFNTTTGLYYALLARSVWKSITFENNTVLYPPEGSRAATFTSATTQIGAVTFAPRAGMGSATIRNNTFVLAGSFDNDGYSNYQPSMVAILVAPTDHSIMIENNKVEFDMHVDGTVASLSGAFVNIIDPTGYTDTFSSNSFATRYINDAGLATDLVVSGGLTTCVAADLTAEQRHIHTHAYDTVYFANPSGPLTDGGAAVRGRPGTTVSGWKLGAVAKWQVDANTYLDAYVSDDGSASTLHLDKVVGGVRTSLTSPVSIPRLTTGTYTWVRIDVIENTVYGHLHTGTGVPNVTTTGTSTISAVLSGDEITKFGDHAQGRVGFSWVPQSSDSDLSDFATLPRGVISATIRGNVVTRVGSEITALTGIDVETTATRFRMLNIEGNDFQRMGHVAGAVGIVLPDDPAIEAVTTRRNNLLPDGSIETIFDRFRGNGRPVSNGYAVTAKDSGFILTYGSGSDGTIYFPGNLPEWFTVTIIQTGAGKAIVAATTGAEIISGPGFDRTNGANSMISCLVQENSDGLQAKVNVGGNGDTA